MKSNKTIITIEIWNIVIWALIILVTGSFLFYGLMKNSELEKQQKNLTQIINEMRDNDKQQLKIGLQSQVSTESDNIRNLLNRLCEKINDEGTEPSLNFDSEIYKKFQQQFETKNYTLVIRKTGELWLCFE